MIPFNLSINVDFFSLRSSSIPCSLPIASSSNLVLDSSSSSSSSTDGSTSLGSESINSLVASSKFVGASVNNSTIGVGTAPKYSLISSAVIFFYIYNSLVLGCLQPCGVGIASF